MIYNFSEIKNQNEAFEKELQVLKNEYQKPQMSEVQVEKLRLKIEEANKADKKEHNKKRLLKLTATAAAIVGIFIILPNTSATIAYAMERIPIIGKFVDVVTFRDYHYEEELFVADVEIPEIKINQQITDNEIKQNLEDTANEINAEIQKNTNELVEYFETQLEDKVGYQNVVVNSEVMATTEDYFTLKINCYYGAGSGYQWNYYYTIDLNTGKFLKLKDIFEEGADYIILISDNIKEQMQEQMLADKQIHYWLNDDIEGGNFDTITEDTSFYINDRGNVVIGFDEGEVAPMYMGAVEFEIPKNVLENIKK